MNLVDVLDRVAALAPSRARATSSRAGYVRMG